MKIWDANKLKEMLPNRAPMLLIDTLWEENENSYIGVKSLTFNEEFFQGHFPGHPIMPGVLQVEAMEQTAICAVLDKFTVADDEFIYLKSMRKVKFRKPNNPGDRIKIETTINNCENNEADIAVVIRNNSGVSCQGQLTLAVRKKVYRESPPVLFNEYDKSANIFMDMEGLKAIMPHRYPFLLIDYIHSVEGPHVIAIKNTSFNEPFFKNCGEGYAVMPAGIQSEIIAQAGCALVLCNPENKDKLAYFMSIEKAEFLEPIIPGDQLICEVDIPQGKSRFGKGEGTIRVGNKIVSKTYMMFAIVEPEQKAT